MRTRARSAAGIFTCGGVAGWVAGARGRLPRGRDGEGGEMADGHNMKQKEAYLEYEEVKKTGRRSRKEKREDEGVYMERGGGSSTRAGERTEERRSPGGGLPVGTLAVGRSRPETTPPSHRSLLLPPPLSLHLHSSSRASCSTAVRTCSLASFLSSFRCPSSQRRSPAHTRLRLPEMSRTLGLAQRLLNSSTASNRLAPPILLWPAPPRRLVDSAVS
ncbi:hypothetical protein L227DRAFT_239226 [Lentinus tigrinus ALCF2SS1-6]|uniref:Uncharacterized protein n=1 Tax=Lentinus tigrinus ALCF2SS1-6 TaxID=1328759 RepID=A0A5C2S1A4_9APHY|nr:hypothetical protein L227DRAFT_239226 [Lentinus tigrinus ALCF2SS1-6]